MTYSFMLDTNTLGSLVDRRTPQAAARLSRHEPSTICVSVISEAEIAFGLAKNPQATRKAALMRAVLATFVIVPWTSKTAAIYGDIRAILKRNGLELGPLDTLIAAHALDAGATLVTNDQAFQRVPGLQTEDWLAV